MLSPESKRLVEQAAVASYKGDRGSGTEIGRLTATPLSEIAAKPVQWLWHKWVPLGAVTVLAGAPKLGKSTFAFQLAAHVSTGSLDGVVSDPAAALIVTFEDSAEWTVKPRALAAGAAVERVHVVAAKPGERIATLPDDCSEIERLIEETGARLVVIDPITAALGTGTDSHKDASVRSALAPLQAVAQRQAVAVVAVMHTNKANGTDLIQRVGGSIAFTGLARQVLVFGRDPHDPDGERSPARVLAQMGNLAPPTVEARTYRIESTTVTDGESEIETSCLIDTGTTQLAPSDLLTTGSGEDMGERAEAMDWLLWRLSQSGAPHLSKTVKTEAKSAGHALKTIDRAQRELGVLSTRKGFPSVTYWELPDSTSPAAPTLASQLESKEGGVTVNPGSQTGETATSGSHSRHMRESGATATGQAEYDGWRERPLEEIAAEIAAGFDAKIKPSSPVELSASSAYAKSPQ